VLGCWEFGALRNWQAAACALLFPPNPVPHLGCAPIRCPHNHEADRTRALRYSLKSHPQCEPQIIKFAVFHPHDRLKPSFPRDVEPALHAKEIVTALPLPAPTESNGLTAVRVHGKREVGNFSALIQWSLAATHDDRYVLSTIDIEP